MGALQRLTSHSQLCKAGKLRVTLPNLLLLCKSMCHNTNDSCKDNLRIQELPEEPTTCCMSGCANCVWLDYAEKLCQYYNDGGEEALKKINENVSDLSIKAFILHEWRMRQQK